MCGINARIDEEKFNLETAYAMTKRIVHRGDGEGLSLSFNKGNKFNIVKSVLKFEEIDNGVLDNTLEKKLEKETDVNKRKDIARLINRRVKQLDNVENALKSSTNMSIIHNRKATYGATTVKNCHPFIKDNMVLYHNGSSYDATSIRKYIEFETGIKITGNTDSAMLLFMFDKYLKKYGDGELTEESLEKTHDALVSVFSPFGVLLLKIGNKMVIFSDGARALYYHYRNNDGKKGAWFISEPVIEEEYDVILKVEYGWAMFDTDDFKLDCSNWVLDNVTDYVKHFYKHYTNYNNCYKCDVCDIKKPTTARVYQYKDMCPECFSANVPIKNYAKEIEFTPKDAVECSKKGTLCYPDPTYPNGVAPPPRPPNKSELEKITRSKKLQKTISHQKKTRVGYRMGAFNSLAYRDVTQDYLDLFRG